jgi:hypothetical protein
VEYTWALVKIVVRFEGVEMPKFYLVALAVILTALGLAGCALCPEREGLAEAATYGMKRAPPEKGTRYDGPWPRANQWADRPNVAAYLRKVVEQEGRQALVSGHGFQCKPDPAADCADCLNCSRAIAWVENNFYSIPGCASAGTMLIEAHIGPGSRVRAMTYWRK